jgi:hypothetical protein
MKFKPGKTFTIKPSGVVVNQSGDFYYWKCTVSGMYTMATKERFEKSVLPEYGNDEFRLTKEFVSAPATRYLAAGYTKEQIEEIAEKNDGKLPSLSGIPRKTRNKDEDPEKNAIKKEREELIESVKPVRQANNLETAVIKTIVVKSADVVVPQKAEKVYAWSGDPNYFKSAAASPIDIGEVTKEACLFPNHFLDSECAECPVYDKCTLSIKFTEETRGKNKRAVAPVVKKIQSWQDDEISVPAETLG